MAEVTFYYGAQVKNEHLPVSVQLKSFTIQYQTTLEGLLPSVQSPLLQSFTVAYDVQIPSFEHVTPKLQEVTLSAEGSYYEHLIGNSVNVEHTHTRRYNGAHITWSGITNVMSVQNSGIKLYSNYVEHIISTGLPVTITSGNSTITFRQLVDLASSIHDVWRRYSQYNITDVLTEYLHTKRYTHAIISGTLITPEHMPLQHIIYLDYALRANEGVSTMFLKGEYTQMNIITGRRIIPQYIGHVIRSELHHPYILSSKHILHNVNYLRHANTQYSLGEKISTQYTVDVNLLETYIKVYVAIDVAVDEIMFDMYTQYAIADMRSWSTEITLEYPMMFEVGDVVVITDGDSFYERTVTAVNADSIVIDSTIPYSIYDGRIYKRVEVDKAHIPYATYTPEMTQYMLLFSPYDCTVSITSPLSEFNVSLSANTYQEITFSVPLEDIMMPESKLHLITVTFGKLTKPYKVYFVKTTAEPLIRSMDANAVKRAILWFDNCLSMEMESIMANLRYEMYTGVSNALNRYVYYMPSSHTNIVASIELPFEQVEVEDIPIYKVITLTGAVWKDNRAYTAVRGALLYVNRYIYHVTAEQASTFDNMVSSISRAPNVPHVFEYTTETDVIPVYLYIPPAFEGSLYRVDILEYYIFDATTGGGSGGVIFG